MDTIPPLSLPILLDGATGSELYKRGMPAGACTEQWVLGHPEACWSSRGVMWRPAARC